MKNIILSLFIIFLLYPSNAYAFTDEFDTYNSDQWEYFGEEGSAYVENGLLKITPPVGQYTTYLRSKNPIVNDLVNYEILFKARYSMLASAGIGIVLGESNPDYPVEFSDPVSSRILTVWQDNRPLFGLFSTVESGNFFNIASSRTTNFHDYRIVRGLGSYHVYVDDVLRYSIESNRDIRHIWFGNPGPATSSVAWPSLEIDYLKVNSIDLAQVDLSIKTNWNEENFQLPLDRELQFEVTAESSGLALPDLEINVGIIEGNGSLVDPFVTTDSSGKAVVLLKPLETGPLKLRFSAGNSYKELTYNVYRPPVVIVPGHGGSFSGAEILLGVTDPTWHWFTEIAMNGWNELIENLEASGYVEDDTYAIAFYDWRKSIGGYTPEARERFLKPVIDSLLEGRPEGQKVNILAHSFGGLVSRSLVDQTEYATKVSRLITFGTPHNGSADAYYAWEGGVAAPKGDAFYRSSVFALTHLLKQTQLFDNRADVIRTLVPSVQELMPVFSPYLYKGGPMITNNLVVGKNPLLQTSLMHIDVFKEKLAEFYIDYVNVVGASHDTIGTIHVADSDTPGIWEDGKPTGTIGKVLGDGTVEAAQALLGNGYDVYSQARHGDLPDGSRAVVAQKLKLEPHEAVVKEMPKVFFTVLLLSPATAEIFDAQGVKVSEQFGLGDNEHTLVYVPDPTEGNYTIKVTGTGNGAYELFANLANDEVYDELSFEKTISTGEVQEFPIVLNSEGLSTMQTVDTTFKWIPGSLVIRRNVPYSTVEVMLPADFPVGQLKLDSVTVNNTSIAVTNHTVTKRNKSLKVQIKTMELLKALRNKTGKVQFEMVVSGQTHSLHATGPVNIPTSLRRWMAL